MMNIGSLEILLDLGPSREHSGGGIHDEIRRMLCRLMFDWTRRMIVCVRMEGRNKQSERRSEEDELKMRGMT